MGQISISITKRVPFRDATQEFSNVYVYGSAGLNPSAAAAQSLSDEVVTKEKAFHATSVSFVYARVWSSGGSPSANEMIYEGVLTGTGSTTPNTSMDKERAFLLQWPAGVDSKGRPVKLRKWFHTCGAFGGV